MNLEQEIREAAIARRFRETFTESDFTRLDEGDDAEFYAQERFVSHLDSLALSVVESVVEQLVVEKEPAILDLMAGWDSHIPPSLRPTEVIGLGLNRKELDRNEALTGRVLHDLNKRPTLPFPENTFDVVLNTVSIDYLTRPFEIVTEVGRVLKPGGLFLIIFSNRMFPTKAVRVWREASEEERVLLVEEILRNEGLFERPEVFVAKGSPRPRDDKYADAEPYSDPVYAVFADRKVPAGSIAKRPKRPSVHLVFGEEISPSEFEGRLEAVKHTLRCPYCNEQLTKLFLDDSPFVEWENEFFYTCLNEFCSYVVRGYTESYRSGQRGVSYSFLYDPLHDRCCAMPVPSFKTLKARLARDQTKSLVPED